MAPAAAGIVWDRDFGMCSYLGEDQAGGVGFVRNREMQYDHHVHSPAMEKRCSDPASGRALFHGDIYIEFCADLLWYLLGSGQKQGAEGIVCWVRRNYYGEEKFDIGSVQGGYCLSVVFIHVQFPPPFGRYVEAVAKTAVPFFLMTSGFYLGHSSGDTLDKAIKKRMMKLLQLIGIAFAVYLGNDLFRCFLGNVRTNLSITEYFKVLVSGETLIKFLFFNIMPVTMPMGWFLLAQLYAYWVIRMLNRVRGIAFAYQGIPFLFAGYFLIRIIIPAMIGVKEDNEFVWILSRNWLFDALPFMLLGMCMASNREVIAKKTKPDIALFYVIFFSFLAVGEYILFSYLDRSCDYYISNILAVICIFVVAIDNGGLVKENNVLVKIGQRHSTFIYIIHGFMIMAVNTVLNFFHLRNHYTEWFLPVYVLTASLGGSVIWNQVCGKFHHFKTIRGKG